MKRLVLPLYMIMAVLSGCSDPLDNPGDKPYNILLITIDTLRADHLGVYGNDRIRTPYIDKLAEEGVCFRKAYTPCPTTLPAHVSLMTGTYPTFHGVRNNGIFTAHESLTTLAEVLKKRGYATSAVIAAYVLDATYGLQQGFDSYDDDLGGTKDMEAKAVFPERKAQVITQRAFNFLRQNDEKPFFLWLHYYDPHAKWDPPPRFAREYADCLYDGEIAYVDEQIGSLLKMLKMKGLEEDTLVAVVSDHGEGLMEHGEEEHGILTYDSTLHVAMILNNPRLIPEPKSIEAPVSLIDLMPTILDILNVEAGREAPDMQGKSLVPLITGQETSAHELLYFETLLPFFDYGWAGLKGVRSDELKYISAPEPELYDLASDPGEEKNLYESRKPIAERFHLAMKETVARITGSGKAEAGKDLGSEARKLLSALGYSSGVYHTGLDADPFNGANPMARIWVLPAINEAAALFEQGRFNEALADLEKLLDEEPENSHVLITLADMYKEMGRMDMAETYFKRHLEIRPNDSEALTNLSKVLQIQGKTDEAIETLDTICKLYPWEERNVVYNIALIRMERGESEQAEKLLLRAVELDPTFANAYNNLGSLCGQRGAYSEAVNYFKKAIAIDPEMGEAHLNCAVSLIMLEEFKKAIPHMDKAQQLGQIPDPALLEKLKPYKK
ncbi:MAG: sulfatase-like hydrolase/transferase [Planctomycetota bacterium]